MSEDPAQVIELARVDTVEQGCARLGRMLGLDGPVEEAVLRGALEDSTYAHNLFVTRHTPAFRDRLLSSPPSLDTHEASNAELLTRASSALWRWGRSGFARVDDATRERRISACLACPHLTEPSGHLIQRIASSRTEELAGKICGICGCVAARKAAVPTESCPAPHSTAAGFTRWGEPA